MPLQLVIAGALLAATLLLGCGGADDGESRGASEAPPGANSVTALAALARAPARHGEFVFRADASPAIHDPVALDGSYLVRFEQYAPEDPRLDFTTQTPFSAALMRRTGDLSAAVKLFETAARSGRRTVKLSGRYLLEVSFGDFPYVVRFTPRR